MPSAADDQQHQRAPWASTRSRRHELGQLVYQPGIGGVVLGDALRDLDQLHHTLHVELAEFVGAVENSRETNPDLRQRFRIAGHGGHVHVDVEKVRLGLKPVVGALRVGRHGNQLQAISIDISVTNPQDWYRVGGLASGLMQQIAVIRSSTGRTQPGAGERLTATCKQKS